MASVTPQFSKYIEQRYIIHVIQQLYLQIVILLLMWNVFSVHYNSCNTVNAFFDVYFFYPVRSKQPIENVF